MRGADEAPGLGMAGLSYVCLSPRGLGMHTATKGTDNWEASQLPIRGSSTAHFTARRDSEDGPILLQNEGIIEAYQSGMADFEPMTLMRSPPQGQRITQEGARIPTRTGEAPLLEHLASAPGQRLG